MVCPYCNFDYTMDDPCFCHPPVEVTSVAPSEQKPVQHEVLPVLIRLQPRARASAKAY